MFFIKNIHGEPAWFRKNNSLKKYEISFLFCWKYSRIKGKTTRRRNGKWTFAATPDPVLVPMPAPDTANAATVWRTTGIITRGYRAVSFLRLGKPPMTAALKLCAGIRVLLWNKGTNPLSWFHANNGWNPDLGGFHPLFFYQSYSRSFPSQSKEG